MTAPTISKSWLTSWEGPQLWLPLISSVMLPSSCMRLLMWFLITNAASLVNVFSAGRSRVVQLSHDILQLSQVCRPVTRLCSLSWARDHVGDMEFLKIRWVWTDLATVEAHLFLSWTIHGWSGVCLLFHQNIEKEIGQTFKKIVFKIHLFYALYSL